MDFFKQDYGIFGKGTAGYINYMRHFEYCFETEKKDPFTDTELDDELDDDLESDFDWDE